MLLVTREMIRLQRSQHHGLHASGQDLGIGSFGGVVAYPQSPELQPFLSNNVKSAAEQLADRRPQSRQAHSVRIAPWTDAKHVGRHCVDFAARCDETTLGRSSGS